MSADEQSKHTEFAKLGAIITVLLIGMVIGVAIGLQENDTSPVSGEPSVSCITYTDDTGDATGMCFVSGDVDFNWLDARNVEVTNGTVTLDKLPKNNSTVRRQP